MREKNRASIEPQSLDRGIQTELEDLAEQIAASIEPQSLDRGIDAVPDPIEQHVHIASIEPQSLDRGITKTRV